MGEGRGTDMLVTTERWKESATKASAVYRGVFSKAGISATADNGEGNEVWESTFDLVELVGVRNIAFAETCASYCKSILAKEGPLVCTFGKRVGESRSLEPGNSFDPFRI